MPIGKRQRGKKTLARIAPHVLALLHHLVCSLQMPRPLPTQPQDAPAAALELGRATVATTPLDTDNAHSTKRKAETIADRPGKRAKTETPTGGDLETMESYAEPVRPWVAHAQLVRLLVGDEQQFPLLTDSGILSLDDSLLHHAAASTIAWVCCDRADLIRPVCANKIILRCSCAHTNRNIRRFVFFLSTWIALRQLQMQLCTQMPSFPSR